MGGPEGLYGVEEVFTRVSEFTGRIDEELVCKSRLKSRL